MSHKCTCPECQPDYRQFDVGCGYCAMTGHEDYPSNKIPCRLGHPDIAAKVAEYFSGPGASSLSGWSK